MRYFLFTVAVFLAGCCGSIETAERESITRDTTISIPAVTIHDTIPLPPVYYGGKNEGCDTAAILASASFSAIRIDTTGRVSIYQYDALKRKFDAVMSKPATTIEVPRVYQYEKTVLQRGPTFWQYLKAGVVGTILTVGLGLIIYGIAKFKLVSIKLN